MQYRKEIDGLRAIAVLPVILFHAGFSGFTGGYIGVDIFFVISGYLITSIILEEITNNQFSIIRFYERRARRILPALSIVLVFTSIAAFIFMPADLLKDYSQSLASVATFTSNIFFYLKSGYFSTASDEKPLLHTWSLAVEEQYYIFFPVMIYSLWFIGKKRLANLIILLSLASLIYSQYLSKIGSVNANFYLIFSRAWELFLGSLIAFFSLKTSLSSTKNWKKEILGVLGLLLITFSITYYDKHTPFPSFYALVPVIGSGLIITFSDKNTFVGQLLAHRFLVAIGVISYSLYLWHQPLLAFLRLKTVGEPTIEMLIFAIALTFIFSILSYRFVEKPFRNKNFLSRKRVFQYSLLSTVFALCIGISGHLAEGFSNRFKEQQLTETIAYSPKREECHTEGTNYLKPKDACRYFGKNITWASFGDSHTVEPAYALARLIEKKQEGLLHLSFSGCPPALQFDVKRPGCSQWVREALAYLESNSNIKNVLLGFRYSIFLFGSQLNAYPELPDITPYHRLVESEKNSAINDIRETYWHSFTEIVTRLLDSGKKVYVLYPIPELPIHISKAVTPLSIFSHQTMLNLSDSTAADYYFKRNHFILEKLDSLEYGGLLQAIKSFEILCNSDYCPAVSDGKALYFDDNHLSISGATKLINNSLIAEPEKPVERVLSRP